MTTLVSIAQGGTGANNATDARLNLGITPASTLNVSANGGTTKLTETLNFINTASVVINVSNAASTTNVSFDVIAGLGFVRDSFVGDGNEVDFTLSGAPVNEDNSLVFVDRVLQRNSEYNVSATTLTFTAAPDNGSVIDVFVTQYLSGNAAVLRTGDTMTGELNVSAKLITQNIEPAANITYDLGTNTKRFKDLWLSNSTIYLGDVQISANAGKLVVPAVETSSGINLESQVANSYAQANAAYGQANTARATANDAYNAANTKVNATGGSITGDLSITGNLTVQGNATTINVSNLSVNDSIMLLASGGTGDSLDIGFVGHIQRGATDTHVGLIRKAVENQFYLFDNYEVEPTNNIINVSGNNFRLANLKLGIANANTFVTSAGLDVTGQANAAYAQANTARTTANNAYDTANNAYTAANNRVLKAGDTMTGQLNISSGGLIVTGNVAIGTSNTSFGGLLVTQTGISSNLAGVQLYNDGSNYGAMQMNGALGGYIDFSTPGVDYLGRIIYRNSSNSMDFVTNTAVRMTIDGSGFVGIGTTNPTTALHVNHTQPIRLTGVNAGSAGIISVVGNMEFYKDATPTRAAAIGMAPVGGAITDDMVFTMYGGSSWAERMRLTNGGDVGIGTANVSSVYSGYPQRLYVKGSMTNGYFGLVTIENNNNGGDVNHGMLHLYNSKTTTTGDDARIMFSFKESDGSIHPLASMGAVKEGSYQGAIQFNTRSAAGTYSEKMRISASGNIGVNNNSPGFKLDVSEAGAVITGTATTGSNMKGLRIYNTTTATTNNAIGLWLATGPHQAGIASFRSVAETGWDTCLAFYTHGDATTNLNDATERMRINGEGYVTKPNQPAFTAVSNAGTTDYTSGSVITFNQTHFNTGSHYNTTNGRFTAPVTGRYLFMYNLYTFSSGLVSVVLTINGSQLGSPAGDTWPLVYGAQDGTTDRTRGLSIILNLNKNDYVEMRVRSGYSARIYMGHSHFSGYLIG